MHELRANPGTESIQYVKPEIHPRKRGKLSFKCTVEKHFWIWLCLAVVAVTHAEQGNTLLSKILHVFVYAWVIAPATASTLP